MLNYRKPLVVLIAKGVSRIRLNWNIIGQPILRMSKGDQVDPKHYPIEGTPLPGMR